MKLYSFNLEDDPVVLILKLDADMVMMYLYTENENEIPSVSGSKVVD